MPGRCQNGVRVSRDPEALLADDPEEVEDWSVRSARLDQLVSQRYKPLDAGYRSAPDVLPEPERDPAQQAGNGHRSRDEQENSG